MSGLSSAIIWVIIFLPLQLPLLVFVVLSIFYNAKIALIAGSVLLLSLFALTVIGVFVDINIGNATFALYLSEGLSSLVLTLIGIGVNVRAERRGEGSAGLFFSAVLAGLPMLLVLLGWSRM